MRPSRRPALKASEIPPQNLNLREGERQSIVCPDCDTWHPLYRKMIKTHHLDREVRGGRAPRCPGSAQLIDMNISVEQWGEAMLAADSTATGRRSARQHYKPIPAPAKPVTKMSPTSTTPADALTAYRTHLRRCRSSALSGRCQGSHRCIEGSRLAALYAELERAQPARDREVRVEAVRARRRAAKTWTRHAGATDSVKSSLAKRGGTAVEEANNTCRTCHATAVSEAKRGGTAVEEANNTCRTCHATAVSEFRDPDVPTKRFQVRA
ncbi:hypothetical protein [Streptomyces sp. NPDC006270]|uniref:hypothetical protein n=1 Tax=Streptomyces sp. NPDC006270 TaxID=3364741 RepID=UPI0036C387EE